MVVPTQCFLYWQPSCSHSLPGCQTGCLHMPTSWDYCCLLCSNQVTPPPKGCTAPHLAQGRRCPHHLQPHPHCPLRHCQQSRCCCCSACCSVSVCCQHQQQHHLMPQHCCCCCCLLRYPHNSAAATLAPAAAAAAVLQCVHHQQGPCFRLACGRTAVRCCRTCHIPWTGTAVLPAPRGGLCVGVGLSQTTAQHSTAGCRQCCCHVRDH